MRDRPVGVVSPAPEVGGTLATLREVQRYVTHRANAAATIPELRPAYGALVRAAAELRIAVAEVEHIAAVLCTCETVGSCAVCRS